MIGRRVSVSDLFALTRREISDEGYLIAPANLSSAGNVQDYSARELGLDGDGDKVISLYRPAEEVFAPEAIASFDGKPVTLNHPPGTVTAENWRDYAVGDTRDVAGSGNHMTGTVFVRDRAAVRDVLDGKSQMSCGYSFDLDMTPGQTADGVAYHGVMRKIRGNHHAIVDQARGGPACRIADTKETHMATRKIVIDRVSLELDDTQASLVEKVVGDALAATKTATDAASASEVRAKAAEASLKTEQDAKAKLVADHAKELADAKAQILPPGAVEALALELSKVVADALVLVPEFKPEGKTASAIRLAVSAESMAKDERLKAIGTAVIGDADIAKPEAAPLVTRLFDALVAAHGKDPASVGDAETTARDAAAAKALLGAQGGDVATANVSRASFLTNLKAGFKKSTGAAS